MPYHICHSSRQKKGAKGANACLLSYKCTWSQGGDVVRHLWVRDGPAKRFLVQSASVLLCVYSQLQTAPATMLASMLRASPRQWLSQTGRPSVRAFAAAADTGSAKPVRILGISGSLRKSSKNTGARMTGWETNVARTHKHTLSHSPSCRHRR